MSGLLGALLGALLVRALADTARGSGPSARFARVVQGILGTIFLVSFGFLLLREGIILGAASVGFLLLALFAQLLGARRIRPKLTAGLFVGGLLGLILTFFLTFFSVYPPR